MPITWEQESDNLIVARVDGEVGQSETVDFQDEVTPAIQAQGAMKLLFILDNFEGWAIDEGWEDSNFMDENDPFMKRIAIVGDEKWRDEALMFTLAGLRPVNIQYFIPEQEEAARAWLTE